MLRKSVTETAKSAKKWAIGGAVVGVPLGVAAGAVGMLAAGLNHYQTGEPPVFAKSLAKAAVLGGPHVAACPYFTVPFVLTVASCAGVGFFAKKGFNQVSHRIAKQLTRASGPSLDILSALKDGDS